MINLEQNILNEQKTKQRDQANNNLNYHFNKKTLDQIFEKTILSTMSDNFLVYEPISFIKMNSYALVLRCKSKIDGLSKVITIYNKSELISNKKADRTMKDIYYSRLLTNHAFSLFQENGFFFKVENDREFLSLEDFIKEKIIFEEKTLKFMFYEIIINLQKIHEKGFVHLNIHPSSIGVNEFGFTFLRDFRYLCNFFDTEKNKDFYWIHERKKNWVFVSPELIMGDSPSAANDFYSIGMIFYWLLVKKLPFNGASIFEYEETLKQTIFKINKNQIPEGWSLECVDFINRLLIKDKKLRLGTFGGAKELFSHPWLYNYAQEFKKVKEKKISLILLNLNENQDIVNEEDEWEDNLIQSKAGTEKNLQLTLEKFFENLNEIDEEADIFFDMYQELFDN